VLLAFALGVEVLSLGLARGRQAAVQGLLRVCCVLFLDRLLCLA